MVGESRPNGERTTVAVDASVRSSTLGLAYDAPAVSRAIETDPLSAFNSTETRPVDANAALVSDPMLYVNETSARWGDPNESATPIRLQLAVYSPKSYPVPVSQLDYNATMNGVPVGDGGTDREYLVPRSRRGRSR